MPAHWRAPLGIATTQSESSAVQCRGHLTPGRTLQALACPTTPRWISDIPHSHLIPWTLKQAGPFHLWGQPLHSEFTLLWSRPGPEARQLVKSTLLGIV